MHQKIDMMCTYPSCRCDNKDKCTSAKNSIEKAIEEMKKYADSVPIKPAPAITPANAKQIAGSHYKQYGNLQPWDVIIAWNMDYLTGTALKYLARWRDKGGIDDLKKAIHFIEKQIEVAESEAAAKIPNQS